MDRRALTCALWVFLGSVVLQASWILALPPFRGLDEFDHAYRAASVAEGQWLPSGRAATHGRGELVEVPEGLVRAAAPECSALPYTGRDNCRAVSVDEDGMATVASAAARYNPVYYWVVGTLAKPFDGAQALYAMRAASALLCSLLLAGAAWIAAGWSRTAWPLGGLIAAVTPVTAYSTAVAAPNGVELCAAAGVWVSLLGLRWSDRPRRLLVAAACFAVPLAGVRGLGPLWLACIVGVGVAWMGVGQLWRVVRSRPWLVTACATGVGAVTLAASAWTLVAGSLELEEHASFPGAVSGTVAQIPLWVLQSLAAFPARNEPAPGVVYAAAGLVLALLLVVAWARATRGMRAVLGGCAAASVTIPFLLQLSTYHATGPIWQGRYGWPLAMGLVMVAAAVLEERSVTHRSARPLSLVAAGLWVLAHAASTTGVLVEELDSSPLSGDPRWLDAAPWVVCALSSVGVLLWVAGALNAGRHAASGIRQLDTDPDRDALRLMWQMPDLERTGHG